MVVDLVAAEVFLNSLLLYLGPHDVWCLRTNTGPDGLWIHIDPGQPGALLKN